MLWLWSCSDSLVAFGSVCLTQKVVWDDESICGYAHFCRWRKTGKGRKNLTWATKMTTRGNLAASLARAAPCTRARVYSVRWTSSLISETLIQSFCDCYNAQFLCATHCYPTSLFATCIPKFHRQACFSLTYKACPFPWSRCKWCLGGARIRFKQIRLKERDPTSVKNWKPRLGTKHTKHKGREEPQMTVVICLCMFMWT